MATSSADRDRMATPMIRRLREHFDTQLRTVRAWLDRHPRIDRALERTGCLRFDRRAVSRGVGVGLFVALTPTVGVQTAMMLGGCLLVRGNFPAAFAVSWISNPVTMAPLYVGYHALGELVFGPIFEAGLQLAGYGENIALEVLYVALGSLLVAVPIAVAGYALLLWAWRNWVIRRRSAGLATRRAERPGRARPGSDSEPDRRRSGDSRR